MPAEELSLTKTPTRSLIHNLALGAIHLLLAVGCIAAFFSVMSFASAKTPQEAAAANGFQMPAGWSAGVFNHGVYYEWYTISDAPWLFAISLVYLFVVPCYLMAASAWEHHKNAGEDRPWFRLTNN